MVIKYFYILLLQLYLSKAHLQNNAHPSVTSYQSVEPAPNAYHRNVKKVLDCRTRSTPEKLPVDYQKNAPLNSGALVLQSLEDEGQPKALEPVSNTKLYVYKDDNDSNENKKFIDNLTDNKDSYNHDHEKGDSNEQDTRRKEKNDPQNEDLKDLRSLNSSEPSLLGKIVERCLTTKLESAHRNGQLHPEALLNSRRKNTYDSNEVVDGSLEKEDRNDEEHLVDPTEGENLRRLTSSNKNVMLTSNKRVCYACTSASNPNCWNPNRLTTVKYCRNGHNSCTTKTYNAGNQLVVIRDCGNSCKSDVGIDPAYTSCSICQSDFCNNTNGAYSVNSHGLIISLFIISFVKAVF